MTACATYQAAGLEMIGERKPDVGTPGAPQLELGSPAQRTLESGKLLTSATKLRSDQYESGPKGFKDDNAQVRPQMEVGGIYYVDGEGDFKYLLRAGGAAAAHVGIVVGNHAGMFVDTMDGGSGGGAKINYHNKHAVKFAQPIGWTLDNPGKSFSQANIAEVDNYMKNFGTEAAVLEWLRKNLLSGKHLLAAIERFDRELMLPGLNEARKKMIAQARAGQFDAARNLIRQVKKGSSGLGQERVLKGWWKPERYTALTYCGRDMVRGWLSA